MKRFKNILLIADSERQQDNALQRAITLAENNQADLTVVRVFNLSCNSNLDDDSSCNKLKNAITEQ